MILLGYSMLHQRHLVKIQGIKYRLKEDNRRTYEVINGLLEVATPLEPAKDVMINIFGVETIIRVQTPWSHSVEYSEQAHKDLMECVDET